MTENVVTLLPVAGQMAALRAVVDALLFARGAHDGPEARRDLAIGAISVLEAERDFPPHAAGPDHARVNAAARAYLRDLIATDPNPPRSAA